MTSPPTAGRGSNQYQSKGSPAVAVAARRDTAGAAAAVSGSQPPHWQSANPSVDHEAVCRRCNDGWHRLCLGHGVGARFESPAAAKAQYPTCLCADQGHPADVTCRESAGGHGRGDAPHPCGKKIKATIQLPEMTRGGELVDRGVCGVHLNAHEKRQEADKTRAAERAAQEVSDRRGEELGRAADDVVDLLAESGVTATRHRDRDWNPDGDVVVNGEQLAALLRRYRLFEDVFGNELPSIPET